MSRVHRRTVRSSSDCSPFGKLENIAPNSPNNEQSETDRTVFRWTLLTTRINHYIPTKTVLETCCETPQMRVLSFHCLSFMHRQSLIEVWCSNWWYIKEDIFKTSKWADKINSRSSKDIVWLKSFMTFNSSLIKFEGGSLSNLSMSICCFVIDHQGNQRLFQNTAGNQLRFTKIYAILYRLYKKL